MDRRTGATLNTIYIGSGPLKSIPKNIYALATDQGCSVDFVVISYGATNQRTTNAVTNKSPTVCV